LFYGGTEELLSKTKEFLNKRYPDLIVAGFISPPFRLLSDFENEQMIERINHSGGPLVFVILGCPKQEEWMASVDKKINAVTIGVGGALPIFIGMQKRAPNWMQDTGLEWFFRLLQKPRRLFKRYFITNSLFLFLLLKKYFEESFAKWAHL
jgi:N-acetylglucosaminyldiphosphoundecaprenol N-acetyl-beta-D-mannosaminyltransferase